MSELPLLSSELLQHYRQISQQVLTVVDVETTGHRALCDRMTEIAVLQATLADGIQHQQTHLMNCQTPIPAKIVRLTGITQDKVDAAPLPQDVLPQYLAWLQSGMLTGHNVAFDYAFIQAEYQRLGIAFSRPASEQLCTVQLARLMLPELPSRSLPNLVRYFKFPVHESHRAAADTLACWLLAKELLHQIQQEDDQILINRFQQEWIPLAVAAALLEVSPEDALAQLTQANLAWRYSRQRSTRMYQRGAVERLRAETIQLSEDHP